MQRTTLAAALALGWVGQAGAQDMRPVLNFETAQTITDHCMDQARDGGAAVAVAVYDQGGVLVVFARMDGVSPGFSEVARWKGRSAAVYLTSTAEKARWNAPTAPMLSTVEGGVPLFEEDGTGLGGVGVSGASSAFDAECGAEGAAAAGLLTRRPDAP